MWRKVKVNEEIKEKKKKGIKSCSEITVKWEFKGEKVVKKRREEDVEGEEVEGERKKEKKKETIWKKERKKERNYFWAVEKAKRKQEKIFTGSP